MNTQDKCQMNNLEHDLDSAPVNVDVLWHSCLSRASASASFQVSLNPCRSSMTVPLQFVIGRPGPFLNLKTSGHSACLVKLILCITDLSFP